MYSGLLYYTNDINHRDPSGTILWHGGISVYTSVFIINIV